MNQTLNFDQMANDFGQIMAAKARLAKATSFGPHIFGIPVYFSSLVPDGVVWMVSGSLYTNATPPEMDWLINGWPEEIALDGDTRP